MSASDHNDFCLHGLRFANCCACNDPLFVFYSSREDEREKTSAVQSSNNTLAKKEP